MFKANLIILAIKRGVPKEIQKIQIAFIWMKINT